MGMEGGAWWCGVRWRCGFELGCCAQPRHCVNMALSLSLFLDAVEGCIEVDVRVL